MAGKERIIVAGAAAAAAAAALLVFTPLDRHGQPREFIVADGEGLTAIADNLQTAGLVRHRWIVSAWAIFTGREKRFRAGRYILSPAVRPAEIVKIVASGAAEPEGILVTIPEGMNAGEIVALLESKGFKNLDLSKFIENEGYLFPDTYYLNGQSLISNSKTDPDDQSVEIRLAKGTFASCKGALCKSDQSVEIIQKLKDNFVEKTTKIFENLDIETRRKMVIVASMLEKEVQRPKDMALVAGIVYKRLELGMPLQIDATVAYGVCRAEWEKQLTTSGAGVSTSYLQRAPLQAAKVPFASHLVDNISHDSEYNTYTRTGLPPGPIANPGLAALRAALNPLPSEFLYYLSARDGTTIFSGTAEEHARNRKKYLNI